MNLGRAIETLTDLVQDRPTYTPHQRRAAVNLGKEALERILVGRNNPGTPWNELLPSETAQWQRGEQCNTHS